jgi:S-layer homology domain
MIQFRPAALIVFLSIGSIGCDRNSLQQAFSADPKAEISTLPTPTSSSPSPSLSPAPIPSDQVAVAPRNPAPSPPIPSALQPYVKDVMQLGRLGNSDLLGKEFNSNQPISRGTFARWLVTVNNRMYRDRPARQIRPAAASNPVFQDVPAGNPNFAYIQGLAESGYLPSALAGDNAQTRFRPSEPLTRETLLLWKVPVDRQQVLPTVSADRVKQLWGFKDTSKIAATALSAIAADHQNGDLSNIRRVFGSTLLFQPQKPVTQAEAAAALWFIGIEGESLSAQDLLRSEQQTRSQSSNSSPSSGSSVGVTPSTTPLEPPSVGPKRLGQP